MKKEILVNGAVLTLLVAAMGWMLNVQSNTADDIRTRIQRLEDKLIPVLVAMEAERILLEEFDSGDDEPVTIENALPEAERRVDDFIAEQRMIDVSRFAEIRKPLERR